MTSRVGRLTQIVSRADGASWDRNLGEVKRTSPRLWLRSSAVLRESGGGNGTGLWWWGAVHPFPSRR